ncbi:hypothetical protein G6F56_004566 [Rhizopus delemar]|nr:hypothetical protein G6F56_004566 [Rhizopus delemar]
MHTYSILTVLSCPFTIQRACELIVDPGQHYKSYIKYLRAFEKIITVTSSWKAFTNTSINQHSADRISTPFIFDDVQIPTEPLDSGEERMETEEPSKINGTHENIDKVVDESKEGKNQQMEIAETTGGTVN